MVAKSLPSMGRDCGLTEILGKSRRKKENWFCPCPKPFREFIADIMDSPAAAAKCGAVPDPLRPVIILRLRHEAGELFKIQFFAAEARPRQSFRLAIAIAKTNQKMLITRG